MRIWKDIENSQIDTILALCNKKDRSFFFYTNFYPILLFFPLMALHPGKIDPHYH